MGEARRPGLAFKFACSILMLLELKSLALGASPSIGGFGSPWLRTPNDQYEGYGGSTVDFGHVAVDPFLVPQPMPYPEGAEGHLQLRPQPGGVEEELERFHEYGLGPVAPASPGPTPGSLLAVQGTAWSVGAAGTRFQSFPRIPVLDLPQAESTSADSTSQKDEPSEAHTAEPLANRAVRDDFWQPVSDRAGDIGEESAVRIDSASTHNFWESEDAEVPDEHDDPYGIGDVDATLAAIERREKQRTRGRKPGQSARVQTVEATADAGRGWGFTYGMQRPLPQIEETKPLPPPVLQGISIDFGQQHHGGNVKGAVPPDRNEGLELSESSSQCQRGPIKELPADTSDLSPTPKSSPGLRSFEGLNLREADPYSVASPLSPQTPQITSLPSLQKLDCFRLDDGDHMLQSNPKSDLQAEGTESPGTGEMSKENLISNETALCLVGKRIDLAQELRWFLSLRTADGEDASSKHKLDRSEVRPDDGGCDINHTSVSGMQPAKSSTKDSVLALVTSESENFDELQRFKIAEMLKEMQRSANAVHDKANGSATYVEHTIYDLLVYNAMMYAEAGAAAAGHASSEEGWAVYRRMQDAGVRPNVVTYTRLLQVIEGAARHGGTEVPQLEKVLSEMRHQGVSPDRECFATMIEVVAAGALYGSSHLSDAYWIVQQMHNAALHEDLPILKTLFLVVIGDARRGLAGPEETERVLNRIKALGLKADLDTYAAAMQSLVCSAACGKAVPSDGEQLLERMQVEGLGASPAFYNAVLQIAAAASKHNRGGVADCQRLMDRMHQELDSPPPLSSFSEMMNVLAEEAKHGRASVEDGVRVLRRMEEVHGDDVWANFVPLLPPGDSDNDEMMPIDPSSSVEGTCIADPVQKKSHIAKYTAKHEQNSQKKPSCKDIKPQEKVSKPVPRRSRSAERLTMMKSAMKHSARQRVGVK